MPRQHVDRLPYHCLGIADLHRGWVGRGAWIGACGRCDKANGENAACFDRAHWSRLTIATGAVGVIESAVPRRPQFVWSSKRSTAVPSDWPRWIPREVGVRPQLRIRLGLGEIRRDHWFPERIAVLGKFS